MKHVTTWLLCAALAAAGLAGAQRSPTDEPLSGIWRLNLAKSRYDPGPPPQSATRVQHLEGDTLKVTLDIVLADGRERDVHFTARVDGKEWKRIDARTLEFTRSTSAGSETGRLQVSEDGRELTLTTSGTDAKGAFHHHLVYERV